MFIDLLDGANFEGIPSDKETDGDEQDMYFNLIDFDMVLSSIKPPQTDPGVLNSILEALS